MKNESHLPDDLNEVYFIFQQKGAGFPFITTNSKINFYLSKQISDYSYLSIEVYTLIKINNYNIIII